jgi:hypothetical protein
MAFSAFMGAINYVDRIGRALALAPSSKILRAYDMFMTQFPLEQTDMLDQRMWTTYCNTYYTAKEMQNASK